MDGFKGNSYKEKEKSVNQPASNSLEEPKFNVKVKKKSIVARLADEMVTVDAPTLADYVIFNVALPKVKSLIWESANDIISMVLYGGNAPKSTSGPIASSNRAFINYNDYARPRVQPNTIDRGAMDLGDLLFESSGDANDFVTYLFEILDRAGKVTMNEMYDAIGKVAPSTCANWGWTDLSGVKTIRVANGYAVRMPKSKPV